MNDFLVFEGITKSFGSHRVLDDVSLSVKKGEVFSLLGPSGCGKTTLLRICAGLETPDYGRVILDGRDITSLSPDRRQVNTVFQSYALFPNMNVFENIAFGLRVSGVNGSTVRTEVNRYLELIQLADHAAKMPDKLSGGQKQRVAIARALINRPAVLLLDEPLAALDLKLRQRMLADLDSIHDEVGITFLYVTHDQGEAMSLSDTMAVMNAGSVEQAGTPAEIYESPRTGFVASFIGDTNFFEGRISELNENHCRVNIKGFADIITLNSAGKNTDDNVCISIRPEKFHVSTSRPEAGLYRNSVTGIVEQVSYMGPHTRYRVNVNGFPVEARLLHELHPSDKKSPLRGDTVWLSWHAGSGYMLEKSARQDESVIYENAAGETR